jgi:hypothetical protein
MDWAKSPPGALFPSFQLGQQSSLSSNLLICLKENPKQRSHPPIKGKKSQSSPFLLVRLNFDEFSFQIESRMAAQQPQQDGDVQGFWLFDGLEEEPYGLLPLVNLAGKGGPTSTKGPERIGSYQWRLEDDEPVIMVGQNNVGFER